MSKMTPTRSCIRSPSSDSNDDDSSSAERSGDDQAGNLSDWYLPISYCCKRHLEKIEGTPKSAHTWRMKERMKTVSVALVLCLNVGVDPPDVLKIQPCARKECWIDPLASGAKKALENIGNALQKQYERWQPRARSKLSLDPTLDEVNKLCLSLRRNAKEERVLFHYNGHGVPKPTDNGEIWVFNKNYTQYIPLSLYNLQMWMGTPSIYVFDCSNAGIILSKFTEFQQQRESKNDNGSSMSSSTGSISQSSRSCILLGACGATELLPMNADLPADLFTSCLTTPIKMALRWYVLQNSGKLVKDITQEDIDKMPGQVNDRRTMLGELNWIFTAITDTIAWNVLPREVFQRLFRQDLLVASLFRNFLLAERIMRSYDCTPVSNQRLPSTYQHPMWQAWDFTLDSCLSQLPAILNKKAEFHFSPFFAEQLTAFQVWLEYGQHVNNSPEQLPIVLQVLLSQVHRLRALDLLSRFLDHGSKAVSLALSVGIFPYVLKLLQSSARELRPLLVFIWAKILSVDSSCQTDLVKDGGHKYFLFVLDDRDMAAEYRAMAAFVLAMIVNNYTSGQETVLQSGAISVCLVHLECKFDYKLRQWCALCLGKIWSDFHTAKWAGVRDNAHEKLYRLLSDEHPEVRAAAIFALGTFINQKEGRTEHSMTIDHSVGTKLCSMSTDCSPLVRQELTSAFAGFIAVNENQFIAAAHLASEEEGTSPDPSPNQVSSPKNASAFRSHPGSPSITGASFLSGSAGSSGNSSLDYSSAVLEPLTPPSMKRAMSSSSMPALTNVFSLTWRVLIQLAVDPFPEVNQSAGIIVNALKSKAASLPKSKGVSMTRGFNSSGNFSAPSSPTSTRIHHKDSPHSQSPLSKRHASYDKTDGYSNSTSRQMSQPPPDSGSDKLVDTQFFPWSCKMFEESVMAGFCTNGQTDHPEGKQERKLQLMDHVKVKQTALAEQLKAQYTPLESEVFANKIPVMPSLLRFHPYGIRLAVADSESVGIWDWEAGVRLNHFFNQNSKNSKITGLEYMNVQENESTLLSVGTDDGCIRIWKDFSKRNSGLQLVTAWQALNETRPAKQAGLPGLIMEWQQQSSHLFCSGNARIIRIWDTYKEVKVTDMSTGSDMCITSLCADPVNRNRVIASSVDGTVKVFDSRLPPHDSRVCAFVHGGWVLNSQVMKGPDGHIVSAGRTGEIKFWDMRRRECTGSFTAGANLRSMVLHKDAEIIACGMSDQMITIYNISGEITSNIKYHEGFMQTRVAKVNCLAFHPHLVRLASGNVDGMVTVYSMSDKPRR